MAKAKRNKRATGATPTPDTKRGKKAPPAPNKLPREEEEPEGDRALQLGDQTHRFLGFSRRHSVTPEEAARLLLDAFEYKGLVKHSGGCHCGAVRFEVWASPDLHVFDCNCSICVKKQNRHFIVPSSRFKLLKGGDNLTTYNFNTKKAQHTFCKTCGVQSFYTPRSNPDGYGTSTEPEDVLFIQDGGNQALEEQRWLLEKGIAPHCLDDGTVHSVNVEQINGKEWEKAMKEHKSIRSMSKS